MVNIMNMYCSREVKEIKKAGIKHQIEYNKELNQEVVVIGTH